MRYSRYRWWQIPAAVLVILLTWVAADLSAARPHSLADFDPHAVARLETAMWRSYYARERLPLFAELSQLLRTQYHLPLWASYLGAYHGARAAALFQNSHNDSHNALPDLRAYYDLIRKRSAMPFDADRVAARELDWWMLHRQRSPGLEQALAELQTAIYHQPPTDFAEHAKARAEAMLLRDSQAESGPLTDSDWTRIGILLDRSWTALHTAVTR
jgi:hypothetical protein